MVMVAEKKRSVGMELRLLRTERGLSLREASEGIGISENYLSQIERDVKTPANDEIIKNIASFYKLDEKDLFDKFDKISLSVQEYFKENDTIGKFMYNVATNKEITEDDRTKINEAIGLLYERHFGKKRGE